jgi:hypothetical protein
VSVQYAYSSFVCPTRMSAQYGISVCRVYLSAEYVLLQSRLVCPKCPSVQNVCLSNILSVEYVCLPVEYVHLSSLAVQLCQSVDYVSVERIHQLRMYVYLKRSASLSV